MTPLVLVQGFMGGSAQWQLQLADLGMHFKIIAVDLPGFGMHSNLPVIDTIAGLAAWVIAELRVQGVGGYHVLGHFMGG